MAVILDCFRDKRCLALKQSLQEEGVRDTDTDEEIPAGDVIASGLQGAEKLLQDSIRIIVSLFDHVSEAHAHLATVAAHLSSLGKILDKDNFQLILKAAVRPLVQLNIPERYLDPLLDKPVDTSRGNLQKKIRKDLLPMNDHPCIQRNLTTDRLGHFSL